MEIAIVLIPASLILLVLLAYQLIRHRTDQNSPEDEQPATPQPAGPHTPIGTKVEDLSEHQRKELEEILEVLPLAARLGYGRMQPRGCMIPFERLRRMRAMMSDDEIVAVFEAADKNATSKPAT